MSTATATPNGVSTPEMKKIIDDQRSAEAAGRNLYQTFKATTGSFVRKSVSWLDGLLERTGVKRFFSRIWGFVSPYLSKAGSVASRIGILPSLGFGALTYRGRYWFTVTLERAYRVASFPFRLIARGVAKIMTKLGYVQYVNAMNARWTAVELWVVHRYTQLIGWFDDNHSSWGLRTARNGLFALMALRAIAMVPYLPLKVVGFIAMLLFPTSELREGPDETYPDSVGYQVFDVAMLLLGKANPATAAATVTAGTTRSPKPSDLARQAGAQAEADARASGANRIEARKIGQFTRRSFAEKAAASAQPDLSTGPMAPVTA